MNREYTVAKVELIAMLEKHRERHVRTYQAGMDGWRKRSIEALSQNLKLAEAGEKFTFPRLPKPGNFVADYDRAIGLLKMSVGDEAKITSTEYDQYVRDIWPFTGGFKMSNSSYVGGARGMQAMGWDDDEDEE